MAKYGSISFNKSKDICYQCQRDDPNLIKFCDNPECNAFIHRECLKEQIDKCDKCDQTIIITKITDPPLNSLRDSSEILKLEICCNDIYTSILSIIIFIFEAMIPILSVLAVIAIVALFCQISGFLILKYIFNYENTSDHEIFAVGFSFAVLFIISLLITYELYSGDYKYLCRSNSKEEASEKEGDYKSSSYSNPEEETFEMKIIRDE